MSDTLTAILTILAGLFGSGGVVAGWKVWQDRRHGVRQEDRLDRAQTFEELKTIISELRTEVELQKGSNSDLRARVKALEVERQKDREVIEAQREHFTVLEEWIRRGSPPPPPPRPKLV